MDNLKHVVDGISLAAVAATLAGWLPVIAAAMSVIWTALRIYEMKTVQRWINRRKS